MTTSMVSMIPLGVMGKLKPVRVYVKRCMNEYNLSHY